MKAGSKMCVAGEPDEFVGGEAQGARVVELGDELALVDGVGEPHRPRPVGEREGDAGVRLQLPDHLEHEELVEVRVEQRAHDRVDAEGMVPGAGREVDAHDGGPWWVPARHRRRWPDRAYKLGPDSAKSRRPAATAARLDTASRPSLSRGAIRVSR